MKIIRWLLSHTFLILLIVAVIYGYMFWGNLAGEDTPVGKAIAYLSQEFVEVEEFVDAVKSKQAERTGEKPPVEKSFEVAATPDSDVTVTEMDSSAGRQPEQRSIEQLPASISYRNNQMQLTQNSAGSVETENSPQQSARGAAMAESAQPALPAATMNAGQEKFVPVEVEQQLSNVDQHGKVIDASQASNSVKQSWVTARESFYQRNYEKSIQSYQEVIESTEDNFDAYGELGNVYFNQGKNEQAASAYFEAAAILVRKGQVNRARSLMGLLRHLDRSKADQLQVLIDSAAS